jgi:cysteine desulfurase
MIYLDYNATAPLRAEVKAALTESFELFGNPSSIHSYGRKARHIVEETRETIASALDIAAAQVIFTSGGTEANNLALKGFFPGQEHTIFISALEHESIKKAAPDAYHIPVTLEGTVNCEALAHLLRECRLNFTGPLLVSVMLANNETGVIQPLDKIAAIAKTYDAYVHCDAVQAFGKIPCSMKALGVDTLSVSAHKLGGPKGVGALAVSERFTLYPSLVGGGQERRLRAGTENVLGIVGFGAAVRANCQEEWQLLTSIRDSLENQIQAFSAQPLIFGRQAPRLPNTSCIRMPDMDAELQLMAFDLAGIAVSAGSACSSGRIEASEALIAMGVDRKHAQQAIRVSLGWNTDAAEIKSFIRTWQQLYEKRRQPDTPAMTDNSTSVKNRPHTFMMKETSCV